MPESRPLGPSECEALLRAGVAGRIAVSSPAGPHIVPVNYSVVGSAIVVCTTPYSVLGTYGRDTTLAFEVDQFDHAHQRGWSVVARGRSEVVTDAQDLAAIQRTWAPHPWATGPRPLVLKLPWIELTGRQLGLGWDPMSALPVRRVV